MAMELLETIVYARFNDSDASGYISSISYFSYMEEARTKLFARLQSYIVDEQANFLVASAQCQYEGYERVKEYLSVSTMVTHVGKKSFHLSHVISNSQSGIVIARGNAVIVCFNFDEQITVLIPGGLRNHLERLQD